MHFVGAKLVAGGIENMSASPKHPLTDNERAAIEAMRGVRFLPASFEKRFARDVLFPALETRMLGEKSVPQLWRLFIRYRRQLTCSAQEKARLLALAEKWSAPDFRKQQAAARAQERIDALKRQYQEAMK